MINLLVYLLMALIVFGVFFYIIDLLPLPPTFNRIAKAILALILLLVLLNFALNFTGVGGYGNLGGGPHRLVN